MDRPFDSAETRSARDGQVDQASRLAESVRLARAQGPFWRDRLPDPGRRVPDDHPA